MARPAPQRFSDPDALVEEILARIGPDIRLALPLGLGKPNHIVNALFSRAAADPSISLKIYTALTLEIPQPASELKRRFIEPLKDRFFNGYPPLLYARALRDGSLPENIEVREFFLNPGRWLHAASVQQNYQSVNYTHVKDVLLRLEINLLAQLLAPDPTPASGTVSLSCNPDLSVDLLQFRSAGKIDFLAVGQLNSRLPYLGGEAIRAVEDFELLLEGKEYDYPLFQLPQEPVSLADHAIGLHAARLVRDGGTLQVGIGSIGDAVCHALLLRQQDNNLFHTLLDALQVDRTDPLCCADRFQTGLYAASEMLVEGFLPLLEAGVIKREVDGIALHGGFFLGSPRFYQALERLPARLRDKIGMMPISFINELYGDEAAKRRARVEARFINSALMVTLLGGVVSDGLASGQVISGVGGQYNFVAMAFALAGGRSIITLPATRTKSGRVSSNIRWSYGHLTIPRHLRDIVVTEYGVADLRDKSDAEVIAALLAITDSRFQAELLQQAQQAGKIAGDYQIPVAQRQNTPKKLAAALGPFFASGQLAPFPLGSDFSPVEERLVPALKLLGAQQGNKLALAKLLLQGLQTQPSAADLDALERMQLRHPQNWRDKLYRRLLLAALSASESLR